MARSLSSVLVRTSLSASSTARPRMWIPLSSLPFPPSMEGSNFLWLKAAGSLRKRERMRVPDSSSWHTTICVLNQSMLNKLNKYLQVRVYQINYCRNVYIIIVARILIVPFIELSSLLLKFKKNYFFLNYCFDSFHWWQKVKDGF